MPRTVLGTGHRTVSTSGSEFEEITMQMEKQVKKSQYSIRKAGVPSARGGSIEISLLRGQSFVTLSLGLK